MKKTIYFLLFFIVQAGMAPVWSQSVVLPREDTNYKIIHNSALLLTYDLISSANPLKPVIKNPSQQEDQLFQFVQVAGEDSVFYIKNVASGRYLIKSTLSNYWDMGWADDPVTLPITINPDTLHGMKEEIDAKFRIDTIAGNSDYIHIRCLSNNLMLGVDATTSGSTVYSDKQTTNVNTRFRIVVDGVLDTKALRLLLAEALELYNTTVAGSETGQYPAAQRNAFWTIIEYCQSIVDDEDAGLGELISQEEVNQAVIDLREEMTEYKNSKNPFKPNVMSTYYIRQQGGLYFTSSATIATATYAKDQHFFFENVAGKEGVYYIKSADTEQYMVRDTASSNGWSIKWSIDIPTLLPEFSMFKIVPTGTEDYYNIINQGVHPNRGNACMGSDGTSNGSGVYLDKDGTDAKHLWMIIATTQAQTQELILAIQNVEAFLETAVKGTETGEYPAEQYDALAAALVDANALLNKPGATQEEIDLGTETLKKALSDCKEAENPYLPETGTDYYIIHHSGLYLAEYTDEESGAVNKLVLSTKGDGDNQIFQFVAVPDVPGTFNIRVKSLGQYLTRKIEPASDDYATIWADDASSSYAQFIIKNNANRDYLTIKCMAVGPTRSNSYLGSDNTNDKTGVWIDKTGDANNFYWQLVKTGLNSIDLLNRNNLKIFSAGKSLTVSNLKGSNTVLVYSIDGQLVSKATTASSSYTTGYLKQGVYIVIVNGDAPGKSKVIVN